MKIVNLETFLTYPADTLFCKYKSHGLFGDLELKVCDPGEGWEPDFVSVQVSGPGLAIHGCSDSEQYDKKIEAAENGEEFRIDYECGGRDGYFETDQLFAVYNQEDLRLLSNKLIGLLTDDQRLELFAEYCESCGKNDPTCKCWNDE